jgi:hypothetical protein
MAQLIGEENERKLIGYEIEKYFCNGKAALNGNVWQLKAAARKCGNENRKPLSAW